MGAGSFVAQFDAPEVAEPGHAAFDDVTQDAQAAAVFTARPGEHGNDAALAARRDVLRRPVGPIAQQRPRFLARAAARPADRRHGIDQRHRHLGVVHIRWRGYHRQRRSAGIGQTVPFAAVFRPIRGVRPGVRPPKRARTLALSSTQRDALIRPRRPILPRSF